MSLFIIRVRSDALPSPPMEIRPVLKVQEVRGKKKSNKFVKQRAGQE